MSSPRDIDGMARYFSHNTAEGVIVLTHITRILTIAMLLSMFAVAGQPLEQHGEVEVVFGYPTPWELWYSGGSAFEPEPQDDFFFTSQESAGITTDPDEEPIPPKKKRKKRRKGGGNAPKIPGLKTMKRKAPPKGPTRSSAGSRRRL